MGKLDLRDLHDMTIKPLSDKVSVSPQITVADLQALAADGYTCVICNRPDGEDPDQPTFAEIEAAARAAGIAAVHIPVRPGHATAEDVTAFSTAVRVADGKVLAYCKSGGRAQSLFLASQG